MITVRRSAQRGHFNFGWLDTRHTFSFGEYLDPAHMGFRSLRVINEDRVQPGEGFPTHGHRDMEILTFVVAGSLEHRDSLGNGSVIRPGDVQRMSAGTGVQHSESNASANEPVHLFQVWIIPQYPGGVPSYEQKSFAAPAQPPELRLVATSDGRDGSVTVHQDVAVYLGEIGAAQSVTHELDAKRHAWVQIIRGDISVNGASLASGDGAAISAERRLESVATLPSQLLLFDLA